MPLVAKSLEKFVDKLRAKAAAAAKDENADVVVGFTANYALWVHENLQAIHPVGQAKFLEQPFRENQAKYTAIYVNARRQKRTAAQALLLAGLALQRDAMMLCPVDTGNLRASAFTRLEVKG
jgi:hypothetical protein